MMKLIDILVRELPKRGGWPGGFSSLIQLENGVVINDYEASNPFRSVAICYGHKFEIASDRSIAVSREEYEKALAESNQEWDGVWMPPVGFECEYKDQNTGEWHKASIKYQSDWIVVISVRDLTGEMVEVAKDLVIDVPEFRPLRSEADKKRDAAIKAIDDWLPEYTTDKPSLYHATAMYAAIAAGSIPGVKLED